ncbi:MAG: class I mannose-6-phosphate isomerase [Erysipelotrichaceae bacterium]|nr:class I mannose-6-phosphate isomerase [Erysipelotrichaceae bacterium]
MNYINRETNYDRFPTNVVSKYFKVFSGYDNIINEIKSKQVRIICVETYPGVDDSLLEEFVKGLKPSKTIKSIDMFLDCDALTEKMAEYLTDDRVRGKMFYGDVLEYINQDKLAAFISEVNNYNGTILIYGFGSSLINKGDILIYAELTRWEIQLRYRKGMPNYKCDNYNEDVLRKYKRGYFIEWRIADKLKFNIFEDIDYYVDTTIIEEPKMVEGSGLRFAISELSTKPFRLVPYFDPGVWGGQWMKEVCGLNPNEKNYAWSFDGVPEENSLRFKFDDIVIETPAMNLVKYQPLNLLGENIYKKFGVEFPIRFDFLDTMDGQNLSLQVHPTTKYIYEKFNMPYTQDESYYILDAKQDGGVFLGLKDGVNKEEFIGALRQAQKTNKFNHEKYINRFPAKKHDHFLIPAGTIHCSSYNTMVLEISATPYIFTFKLWDWDRLGLDGRPRPIHIEDGEKVIDYSRTTQWVKDNLVNHFETLHDESDYKEVKTGLHELEFIETHVYTSRNKVIHDTRGTVNMFNLVDGQGAIIESINNEFEPFEIHYAETFIVPACVGKYSIKPTSGEIKYIKAYVR